MFTIPLSFSQRFTHIKRIRVSWKYKYTYNLQFAEEFILAIVLSVFLRFWLLFTLLARAIFPRSIDDIYH